jgi:hypothetical protein
MPNYQESDKSWRVRMPNFILSQTSAMRNELKRAVNWSDTGLTKNSNVKCPAQFTRCGGRRISEFGVQTRPHFLLILKTTDLHLTTLVVGAGDAEHTDEVHEGFSRQRMPAAASL